MGELVVKHDNTDEWLALFESATIKALEEIGFTAETYAKKKCPVDTGTLRRSIVHKVKSSDVFIGTNIKYGKYVELGTHKMKARPFLVPAATEHGEKYRAILKRNLGSK